jgi:D-galactarolactone cycloisomerase
MLIDDVQVELVSIPLSRSYSGSSYSAARRNTMIVTVRTSDGIIGRIHSGDEREHLPELGALVRDVLRPRVIGRSATEIEPLWRELLRAAPSSSNSGDKALYLHALSALDTALWDALAKRADMPTYRLWGGDGSPMPTFVIGGYYGEGKTLDDLVAEVLGYREEGFGGLKLKVGGLTPTADLERLRRVRETLGADFPIACDANQGWDLAQATEFARGAEEYGIVWFEEPVVWYEQERDLPRLRTRTSIPICAGQSEFHPMGAADLVTSGCVDILNYDVSSGGGPTGWRRVSHVADLHGVTLAHHEEPHLSPHLLATVTQRTGAEFFHAERDPVWHELLVERPRIEDGLLHLNTTPGFGLVYDEDVIARFRLT